MSTPTNADAPARSPSISTCESGGGSPGAIEASHALTGMQQGMLVETLGEPGGGVDVMQVVVSMPEAVDARALAEAWQGMALRHAVLRSAFAWGEGEAAAQVVHARVALPLQEIDLRSLGEAQQREAVERFLEGDREAGFDLARAPLMRLCLLRCGEARHEFVWTFHHILLDGRSYPLLLEEVFAAYEALRCGQAPAPAQRRPYEDFAVWLAGQSPADAEPFWRERLRGFAAPTALPWGGPSRDAGPRRGHCELRLTEAETRVLADATARAGLSTAALVQGAWALLLARHGREEEVVFGATRAGRPYALAGSRTMLGLFINTLPVRVGVADDETVGTWLAGLEAQQEGLRSHEHTPLWQVKQWSEVPAAGPLFESVVMYEKYELEEVLQALGGAWARRSVRLFERPGGALLLGAYSGATRLRLQLWWDGERLSRDVAEGLLVQLRTLLLGMAGDLGQPLSRVPMLTEAERHKIVVEWNRTEVAYPETTIHALFEAQVERTPEAVAVVFEGESLTYRALDERANQLAHTLQSLGVGPDVLVGLCVERSLEMVVGLLGILKAGGAYVPLDPSYPAERLAFMLEDACVPVLLTQERLASCLPRTQARVLCLDGDCAEFEGSPRFKPVMTATAESLAYVIFTSGSTGRPKGAMNTHRGAANILRGAISRDMFPSGARCSAWTSIGFDVSVYEIFGPLAAGCELWIVSDRLREDGAAFLDWLMDSAIQSAYVPPFLLGEWAVHLGEDAAGCTMRRMLVGVEPIRESLLQGLMKAVPGLRIVNGYGPTEAAVCSTFYEVTEVAVEERNTPIGLPLVNTQLYILDRALMPVPIGVAGELYIGGVQVARGYLNRPELTREKFVADPFSATPGARLYRTGDLCRYLPDGNIEFLGRLDHQVKLRGFRIELGEIETVLGQCAGVQQGIVVAREDRPGDKVLVAYVVGEAVVGELRVALGQRLPEYMVPSAFVRLEALPLTPNGKVDRKALPAPTMESKGLSASGAARSPLEALVAEAFGQVLGLSGVGIHDDFFQLGGHSLKAMQLVSRLRTVAVAELAVRAVFDAPTVAGLARAIEVAQARGVGVLPALRARPLAEECALSYAQQRLWFLDQWEGPGGTYNIPAAWRLRGALNVAALERALETMVARHEVLRTVYRSVEGEPIARVLPVGAGLLSVVDLRAVPEREAAMTALVAAEAGRAFDLASGPVLRASLAVLGEAEHVLVVCVHHIAFDGWSQGVFWRELSVCYGAYCEGREAGLPELAVQYADYACWQRGWLEGEVLAAQALAWKEALAGYPQVLELPTDRPRPVRQTHRGGVETVVLPVAVQEAVQALARREGVTVFMVLLGAFQALLHRYTGQAQLLVGTPVAGRQHEALEGLIGFFVNTLVMKADFTDESSFREHLGRVRAAALEAYAHQDVPFEKLVEVLGVTRDPSRSPLFQVMFSMVEAGGDSPTLGGLAMERVEAERCSAKFDLGLFMAAGEGGLVASLEYNADLFEAGTAARMLGHLGVLLTDAVARPETPVGRLALLTEAERHRIVVEWNQTTTDYPETTIHALFEAQVERTPDAVAVVFEGESLSYRTLDERANQLAHYLQSLGVGPDVLVGLCVERSLEMVVGLLGILKAGGAYVPLDPTYPKERIAFMLEDTRARVLLTQERLIATLPEHRAQVFALDVGWERIARERVDTPASRAEPDDLAYVIYTSGSTGRPKGVLVEHRGVCNLAQAQGRAFGVQGGSRILQFSSFSFDAAVWEVFMALTAGGTLVLARREALLPGPDLSGLLRDQAINMLTLPPIALTLLSEEQFPALRGLIVAGEPCPADLASCWARDRRFFNAYGPTETTVCATLKECRSDDGRPPIGRPIANTRVYVLDPHGQPVPVGVAGELYIGGVQVARGYLNRPELTRERFVADPFSETPGARLYRTGDLCRYLPDGNIEFLGRLDHQVKLRGFRIELGEIEASLGQCAGVQQCIVVMREDRPGDKVLVAYVVGKAVVGELRAALGQRLPEYMVPSAFVRLEALPLTPNGKVDRKALPAPTMESRGLSAVGAARSPLEALVAEAFTQVLGLPGVGIHDDFFQLGGHSLKAMQLVSRLRTLASAELGVRVVFDAPTVAGLARAIEVARAGGVRVLPALRARAGAEDCALSYAQQRLWFLDQWEGPGGTYNIPAAWRLRGALNVAALERALETMVARHEVLRTVYRSVEGEPSARVLPEGAGLLSVVDLREVPEEAREAAMMALVDAEAGRAFDLASGPVLRASLAVLGEAEHVLVVCVHHIAFDGWSQGVFWRELSVCYEAYCERREAGLGGLAVQYADYACWQRGWLEGEVLAAQALAWKEALAGYPQVLELPTDRPRPVRQTHRGGVETMVLPVAVQEAVQALARREGVTVYMVLLGAFQALLHRYTGQAQLLVGTPVAGRQHEDLEGLIGFFVNTLVMKADFTDGPSFQTHLGRVRAAALEAYAHQDVPFEKLVEVLGVTRDPSRSPLFQVMFSMVEKGGNSPTLGGLAMVPVEAERHSAKFDLGLFMAPTGQGLVASLEYNADLFEAETAARMLGHLGVLLADAMARPETPVGRLVLLTEAERHRTVVEWNRTEVAYPETMLQGLFEAQVERTPEAVAVVFEGESLTYRALDERANQLAHALQALGVGPEVLVGICVERSIEMIVGLLGILKAGGAYVPLDPSYPAERLVFMLEDACVPVLLTQERLAGSLPRNQAQVMCLDAEGQAWKDLPRFKPSINATAESLAYVIFTSGSTGRPKGAMNTHRGIVNRLLWMQGEFEIGAADRVLQKTPFGFDVSVWELFWPLLSGAALVMARPEGHKDPAYLTRIIVEQGVTTLHFVPSMMEAFLDDPGVSRCTSVRRVITSGEALPAGLAARFFARMGWAALCNLYGPTEAAVDVTSWWCAPGASVIPIGKPIANTRLYVLDPQGQPVPVGVAGELYIGGVQVARGYLNRPALTREKFVADPFSATPGARLYRTGDLCRYLPDGNIEFLGRLDHQVKLRGFRIELGEIEAVLGQCAGVQQCIVVAREDRPGDKVLVAYVVGEAVVGELRAALGQRLPEYMVPSAFVRLQALPLTPNGKVDRKALPAPTMDSRGWSASGAPRSPLEELLTTVRIRSAAPTRSGGDR
jgi:amino acid adenylation domain-containing protein